MDSRQENKQEGYLQLYSELTEPFPVQEQRDVPQFQSEFINRKLNACVYDSSQGQGSGEDRPGMGQGSIQSKSGRRHDSGNVGPRERTVSSAHRRNLSEQFKKDRHCHQSTLTSECLIQGKAVAMSPQPLNSQSRKASHSAFSSRS